MQTETKTNGLLEESTCGPGREPGGGRVAHSE